ncbi:MAG: DUF5777 family beta-barrel protein [Myxococcota bacterium]|jgi:hypothetical protein|nr:DUF5777 family beta-barrel protein [Myxococcota bacterium]
MRFWTYAFCLAFVFAPSALWAQEEEIEELDFEEIEEVEPSAAYYGQGFAQHERALNLLSAKTTRKGTFLSLVAHRTNSTFMKDSGHNLLGFDDGALKIGLGLRYGVLDNLDIGFYRLNNVVVYDHYELDARWQMLSQDSFGIDMALRGGATFFTAKGYESATAYLGQLLLDKKFGNRLFVGAGLLFHSDSSNLDKENEDVDWTLGAQLYAEYRFCETWAFVAETAPALSGYGEKYPTFSLGPKIYTNRHTFAVVISNTQMMDANGVMTNSVRKFDELILGFNISREI